MAPAFQASLFEPTYFVDRCIGAKSFALPLRELGFQVEHLNDHFAVDTADEVWIPEVTRKSWIIVSADFRIRYRAAEIEAFRDCGARMLLLNQKLTPTERIEVFVAAKAKIELTLRKVKPPWIARILPQKPKSTYGRLGADLQLLELADTRDH